MHVKKIAALGVVLAASLFGHSQPAQAGDVSNAGLTCFVDTRAFDQPTLGQCHSVWTPGTANNPSVAVFQAVNLTTGNYSFAWTNLETGQPIATCANMSSCRISIRTETSGDGEAHLSVKITDLATNLAKTVAASAYYWDGYN